MHYVHWDISFCMPQGKNGFSWLTSHTSTSSFTCWNTGWKGVLTQRLGADQTHDNPQETDENDMEDAPIPQSSFAQGCQWCGGQFADGHFHSKMQHPLLAFLGVLFQYLISTSPGAFDSNNHCLLLCPTLDIVPEMVLVSPRRVPTPLSANCYILNFLICTWSCSLHHATVTLSCHLSCDLYYSLNPSLSPLLPQVLLRHSMTHCQVGFFSL